MALPEGTQPETTAQLYLCKFCGMLYPESSGRLHGKTFACTPCGNHDRALRRNLAQQSELGTFSPEESKDFFRKLLERKQQSATGRLAWTTVRATMITSLTERQIMSYRGDVECAELPLSVYVSKGWPEEVVKKCDKVWSDDYGVWCYKVPIKKQTWSECRERMETKVLQQEQEATKKNTKGRKKEGEEDWDVPVAADTSSTEKQESKRAVAESKKLCAQNHKIATAAAKAVGSLAQAEAALKASELKAEQACVGSDVLLVSRPVSTKLQTWYTAARSAMDAQETNRKLAEGVSPTALQPLPWDAEDLKATLKQVSELQKALKNCLPVKPKRTTPAGGGAQGTSAPEAEAPKRRRTKTPA